MAYTKDFEQIEFNFVPSFSTKKMAIKVTSRFFTFSFAKLHSTMHMCNTCVEIAKLNSTMHMCNTCVEIKV